MFNQRKQEEGESVDAFITALESVDAFITALYVWVV